MIRFTDAGVPYTIEMQDYRVRSGLSVVSVSSTKEGDLPLAIVELRNTTASELRFDAQFTWTTAEGRVLADQGHMMRGQHVGPGATISLQNAAGRADAQRFKLQIRSAQ